MSDLFESTNTRQGKNALAQNENYFANNSAFGVNALMENNSGTCNTAIGTLALATNTAGSWNTSIGASALYNSFGNGNVACGANSLEKNLSGSYNIGVGLKALYNNTIGINNVSIGVSAGEGNIDGNNNTYVGNYTSTTGAFSCSTAIGFQSKITDHHQIVLGTSEDTVYIPGSLSFGSNKLKAKRLVIEESIKTPYLEIYSAPQNQDILCSLKSTNDYHLDPIGYNDVFDKLGPLLYINKKTGSIDIGLNVDEVSELYPMVVNDTNINYIGLIGILINQVQWLKNEVYTLTTMLKTEKKELNKECQKEGDPKEGDPKEGDPKEGDPKEGDPKEGDPKEGDPLNIIEEIVNDTINIIISETDNL